MDAGVRELRTVQRPREVKTSTRSDGCSDWAPHVGVQLMHGASVQLVRQVWTRSSQEYTYR